MDSNFFMNSSIQPQIQYDHQFSNTMHTWESLSTPMQIQTTQPHDLFHNDHFDSTLTSMVSSPTSNPTTSTDNFMIRELIGKLGSICNPNDLPNYITNGNSSTNNSCYNTPLNSPPKLAISMPIMDGMVNENISSLGKLSPMPNDLGFVERVARFSSFGSRSFNGRTNQIGVNNDNNVNQNGDFVHRSCSKLQRVVSSPLLQVEARCQIDNNNFMNDQNVELCNSRENSSISCQNQTKENNGSSRKRKASVSKGKEKEFGSPSQVPTNSNKVTGNGDDSNAKRSRLDKCNGKEGNKTTKTEENKGGDDGKEEKQKSVEATKDYIHVRARRGQATDSHSLAERVRREKIGERMKLLQDLVPGCNKVTGKALMLEEIINYVQSLQRQVEFLSMKLSNVNPKLEMNMCNLFSKDVVQPNSSMEHPMFQTRMAPTQYGEAQQNHLEDSITTTQCSMDPLNPALINHNHALHLPPIDGFSNYLSQLPSLCEGDLQSIVQMGFGQKENIFQGQTLQGPNPTQMKIEF